ncbi:MAG: helix-turn-helix domain-containing protein [Christensenellaceae bacterium]|jgi:AraC-like DNA-binding protein|nr:helix-turn-helix domain-containing protein [Christensenellaceae bacterium]
MATLLYIAKQPKTLLIPFHKHIDWEIICCTHGSGQLNFSDGSTITYLQNEIVIIPPLVLHTNISDGGFKNIHLVISNWDTALKMPFKIADKDGFIRTLAKRLQMCHVADIKNRAIIIQNYLDLILNLIVSGIEENQHSEYVVLLRNKLLENFTDENFNIIACMKDIPLNPEYLRKLFKKELGISPIQFLLKIRLESANRLLLSVQSNKHKLNEIAHMSGFNDSLYFSRMYKKKYGMSPKNKMQSFLLNTSNIERKQHE